jgi:ssDNA-binding Zn-finger/Zn-ribbon topoisomerase 1
MSEDKNPHHDYLVHGSFRINPEKEEFSYKVQCCGEPYPIKKKLSELTHRGSDFFYDESTCPKCRKNHTLFLYPFVDWSDNIEKRVAEEHRKFLEGSMKR